MLISQIRRDAMLRVFSTIGFDLIFTLNTPVLNQDLLDFEDYRDRLRFKLPRHKKGQMPLAPEVYKSTGDSPIHVCGKIPFVSFGKI